MKITRGRALLGTTSLVATLGLLGSLVPSGASSHREAPIIREDPVADATDFYAFVAPDDPTKVTFIANYYPNQEPAGGPNFYDFGDDVNYQISIDNNGDAVNDITYEFRFTKQIQNGDTFTKSPEPVFDPSAPRVVVAKRCDCVYAPMTASGSVGPVVP